MNDFTPKIIEDSSPYYIRYKHDNIDTVVQYCLNLAKKNQYGAGFTHQALELDQALLLLDLIPESKIFELNKHRVSLFVTSPGHYYKAHKDGLDHRFSINYTIQILDDKCVTKWYSDEDLKDYAIDNLKYLERYKNKNSYAYNNGISREVVDFKKDKHVPIKSMTARPNEVILFNTDIFHDFDNSQSSNQRIVLTLRAAEPKDIYFEDAKKILFSRL